MLNMPATNDDPGSALFKPLPIKGNVALSELEGSGISKEMSAALEHAPEGKCTGWGIRFEADTYHGHTPATDHPAHH
jgi:hypothetical protein